MKHARVLADAVTLIAAAYMGAACIHAQETRRTGPQASRPAEEALDAAPPLTRLFALDAYTEYDLLDDPSSHAFRIVFMPLETRPGSTVLINGTRHGSDGGAVEVYDPRTGHPLKFEYVPGADLIARGVAGRFTPEDHYIKADLPRPVPAGGEGRVLIYKTYKDARTYYADADGIVWVRPLSAQRFAIILPRGYTLISANIAAQIMTTLDGRLKLSLTNPSGGGSPITIRARKTAAAFAAPADGDSPDKIRDDSKTLYDLGDPDTHTFTLEQTYSDTHHGSRVKLDIVRYAPLTALKVVDLDTAELLHYAKDAGATWATLAVPITNDKQSAHLKVSGSIQDPAYRIEHGELIFEREVHGLRNTILLPAGWEVARVSQPATVGVYQGRAFVALVAIQQDDAVRVAVQARRKP